jgi:hypothetical protein
VRAVAIATKQNVGIALKQGLPRSTARREITRNASNVSVVEQAECVGWLAHTAGHCQSIAFWVWCHSEMLTCAHEKDGIKKVRYVLSNTRDASEIHRRQAGATPKRGTVKHDGVRAQTVRVCCASSCNRNKAKYRHCIEARSTARPEIPQSASNAICGRASLVRWLVGAHRRALSINRVLGVVSL